jgi:hypothetical protein
MFASLVEIASGSSLSCNVDKILKRTSSGSHNAVGSGSLMIRMTVGLRMKETKVLETRGKEKGKNAGGQTKS